MRFYCLENVSTNQGNLCRVHQKREEKANAELSTYNCTERICFQLAKLIAMGIFSADAVRIKALTRGMDAALLQLYKSLTVADQNF